MPRIARSLFWLVVASACAIVAVGCSPRVAYESSPLTPPASFSEAGTASVPDRWWTTLDDPVLDRLVSRALATNFDLRSAWFRLRQAQAVADRQSAPLLPTIDAEAEGQLERGADRDEESLRLGLAAGYELDLWGRIRSSAEAERLRAEASMEDYQAAALSVAAEVVRTWAQLVEAQKRRDLLEDQVRTNEKVLRLIRARFGSGTVRSVDILRQRQLVESTREQRIDAEARIEVLRHQLAVLLGQAPQDTLGVEIEDLPELPPLPDVGLPAQLVQRRPDVRRAFLLLRAADRDVAAAISNRYPRLTLTGSLSTEANDTDRLFDDWIRSLAANLVAPLFDGGERRAEVERTRAVMEQRLAEYSQTTLLAYREVEDALVQEAKQSERIDSLQQQLELVTQSYEQLQIEYLNGVSDYIDVLTALTDQQRIRRDLVEAQRIRLERRIALYRALAGGFEPEPARSS